MQPQGAGPFSASPGASLCLLAAGKQHYWACAGEVRRPEATLLATQDPREAMDRAAKMELDGKGKLGWPRYNSLACFLSLKRKQDSAIGGLTHKDCLLESGSCTKSGTKQRVRGPYVVPLRSWRLQVKANL